jgi:hypothetical protein
VEKEKMKGGKSKDKKRTVEKVRVREEWKK